MEAKGGNREASEGAIAESQGRDNGGSVGSGEGMSQHGLLMTGCGV